MKDREAEILALPEASGRRELARHLAANTDMPIAGVKAALACAAVDVADLGAEIVEAFRTLRRGPTANPVKLALSRLAPVFDTDPVKVATLAKAGGQFPPIHVARARDGKHTIIDGHHRFAAAKARGDASIPCLIGSLVGGKFLLDPAPDTGCADETPDGAEAAEIVTSHSNSRRARR